MNQSFIEWAKALQARTYRIVEIVRGEKSTLVIIGGLDYACDAIKVFKASQEASRMLDIAFKYDRLAVAIADESAE